jgi:hypothetical protein
MVPKDTKSEALPQMQVTILGYSKKEGGSTMTKERICDRCHKRITGFSIANFIRENFDFSYDISFQKVDLCQECEAEFQAWLRHKKPFVNHIEGFI